MKKYAKILCAILVVASLCASLIFTAGAQEAEPFVPSFTITDFAGKSITSGGNYKSDVEGNRVSGVSTLNPANSPFVSVAMGEAENPYVLVYANQNYSGQPSSNNNLGINIGTSNSAPFTVIGDGAKGYYVIDFDVATHGKLLPKFDVSVVMRRESDTSGFPFSDEIYVGDYITETEAWSHVTLVGDIKNNVVKIYINGAFVADSGRAVRTDSGSNVLSGDTRVVAQGYRIEITRNNQSTSYQLGDNAAFDNFAHRLFIDDGDELTSALSDGDITDWSGYTAGRGEELLPVVATVDGVEYRNFTQVSQAFNTNDTIEVEFLAQPLVPIDFCANANINTNGMEQSALFNLVSGCQITSTDGNLVKTKAPFVSNYAETPVNFNAYSGTSVNIAEIFNATKGNAQGNLYNRFNMVTQTSIKNLGTIGYRNGVIITDTVTGNTIYRESAYAQGGATTTKEQNEYSNFNFNRVQLSYEAGKNEYIVVDFDYTYTGSLDSYLSLLIIPRGSAGYHATSIAVKNLPVKEGEIVHITAVHDFTNNKAQYFINGVLTNTVDGGAINSSHHSKYLNRTEPINVEEYKLGSNSLNTVYFDNMNIRFFDLNSGSDTLAQAINAKDITVWDKNIYTPDYNMAKFPAIATVDGVPYHDEATLEAALYGNKKTPAVVKVLHAFDDVITVNCDATVYTYGQAVKFVDANGRDLTPDKSNVIRVDVPYMQVRVDQLENLTSQDIFDAIKSGVGGNLFYSFVPSAGNWGQIGYRKSSLVTNLETGDVIYRNFAMLDSNGALNSSSAEYVDMSFAATTFNYAPGQNSYVVVDFDFATDRALTDDVSVVLVPSVGATASSGGVVLKDLGVLDGDMAHVTIVYDFTNNYAYAFVNGMFACSVEGGAIADNADYLAGTAITLKNFRLSTEGKTSAVCLDNVAVRAFTYSEEADTLIGTVDSGNITDWSDSVYNDDYVISKIPTVAAVDGRDYGSIDTLNKILEISTNYVKSVEMKYCPEIPVKIMSESTIETNGLDVELDWNTGLYEFDPGVERYRGTRTGLAYASTKFIYTTVGTAYTFKTIDAENCWSNASVAVWAYKVTAPGQTIVFQDYDVVFYPYGEKMEPLESGRYVEGTNLNTITWMEMTITSSTLYSIAQVQEYHVANPTESLKIYVANVRANAATYAATDMLYSANISSDIEFVFYVNKSQTVTNTGNVVTINGKEYVAFTYKLAPHEISKVITVSFEVASGAVIYEQKQDICFIDYVKALLEAGEVDKSLIVSLLNYANESHALFNNGARMPEVTELITEYAEYLPNEALTDKLDTSALSSVVRSASLRLNSAPEFVFKVARGFRGTITLSYNSLGVPVEHSIYVNTLSCEQNITLKGLNVYDLASDITITVTPYGSDESISAQYNLATYAQGLENNSFAVALYNYAKTALKYQSENNEQYIPVK